MKDDFDIEINCNLLTEKILKQIDRRLIRGQAPYSKG